MLWACRPSPITCLKLPTVVLRLHAATFWVCRVEYISIDPLSWVAIYRRVDTLGGSQVAFEFIKSTRLFESMVAGKDIYLPSPVLYMACKTFVRFSETKRIWLSMEHASTLQAGLWLWGAKYTLLMVIGDSTKGLWANSLFAVVKRIESSATIDWIDCSPLPLKVTLKATVPSRSESSKLS